MAKTVKEQTFGRLLKDIRVNYAGIGLRSFASLIEMKPSNLSNLERGKSPPPAGRRKIDLMCDTLGLPKADPRRTQLFDLAAVGSKRIPADVADAIKTQEGIPVLVRTLANKQLSDEKLRELAKHIEKFY